MSTVPPSAPSEAAEGLRCPKCRTVSYAGLMGFPRCHNCHEQLRQCRYCLNQTGGLCELEAGSRPALQSADGLPWCEAYSSRYALSEGAKPLERPVGITPRTMTALAVGCVFVIWIFLLMFGEEHAFRIDARDEAVRVVDGRAVATFLIYGAAGEYAGIQVVIDLTEAPGYAVEEVGVPPGLATAEGLAWHEQPVQTGRPPTVEVVLLAAADSPTRSTVRLSLAARDGEPLASATALLLYPHTTP